MNVFVRHGESSSGWFRAPTSGAGSPTALAALNPLAEPGAVRCFAPRAARSAFTVSLNPDFPESRPLLPVNIGRLASGHRPLLWSHGRKHPVNKRETSRKQTGNKLQTSRKQTVNKRVNNEETSGEQRVNIRETSGVQRVNKQETSGKQTGNKQETLSEQRGNSRWTTSAGAEWRLFAAGYRLGGSLALPTPDSRLSTLDSRQRIIRGLTSPARRLSIRKLLVVPNCAVWAAKPQAVRNDEQRAVPAR